jgi:hypothetical protein
MVKKQGERIRSDMGTPGRPGNGHGDGALASARVLVAIAKPEAALRARASHVASAANADVDVLNRVLGQAHASMRPLFGESEERVQARVAAAAPTGEPAEKPDLHLYYYVEAPDEQLEELASRLAMLPTIAGAYVTPRPELAAAISELARPLVAEAGINAMQAAPIEAPAVTADFTARQGYLNPAAGGIDALYAWTVAGGSGAGVQIIDCEGAWRFFTHEDLKINKGGVIRTETTDIVWRNHGTAVAGVIGGDRNTFGVTGICPDANVRGCSIFDTGGLPAAIVAAADRLRPGDIILIEVQYGHPTKGYTSVEWWPADFAAVRYAVNRGIVVVEAAGNGNNDLDDPVYNTPLAGFPAEWRNPFNRSLRDSGSVLVGAGAPPPGTHGRDHGPDRSRLDFSNYGSAIDVQGWGREVTTTGYGDLQGGINEDIWYTDQFSGTSSASPIVVGALCCVQGVLKGAGRIPLSPARARELLRNSGSPQQDAPGRPRAQRIGNRPNLRQLIPLAFQTREWIGIQFTGIVAANSTGRWFTHSWPAHWHVLWTVVPTNPRPGGPQISWSVQVERSSDRYIAYWISITNHTPEPVNIEARYSVFGW